MNIPGSMKDVLICLDPESDKNTVEFSEEQEIIGEVSDWILKVNLIALVWYYNEIQKYKRQLKALRSKSLDVESQFDSFGMILQWNTEILKTIESFSWLQKLLK